MLLVALEVIVIVVFRCALIGINVPAHLIEWGGPRLFVRIHLFVYLQFLGVPFESTSERRKLQRIVLIIEVIDYNVVEKVNSTAFADGRLICVQLFGEIRFQFDVAQITVLNLPLVGLCL